MSKPSVSNVPYHWWGPGPAPPEPLSLQDLLRDGVLDVESAAKLWAVIASHQSLTIIGGPSGLGKSTLLQALLPSLEKGTQRIYLRGCYETFAFQDDPVFPPARTSLLINEISPHLPIYLWGPAVRRTLAAGESGYQILATAHGRSVVEFAASLTGSPLRIPAHMLSALGLVALMEPVAGREGGRVAGVWQLSPSRDGVVIDHLDANDLPAGVSSGQISLARAVVLELLARG